MSDAFKAIADALEAVIRGKAYKEHDDDSGQEAECKLFHTWAS